MLLEPGQDFVGVAWSVVRLWWLIIAIAFAAGSGAFLVSRVLPPQYEASATVLVGSLVEANYDQQLAYQQLAQTYVAIATTTPVMESVANRLGGHEDPRELVKRIDVRAPLGQNIVRIRARGATGADAAALANATATAIVELGRTSDPAIPATASTAAIIDPASPPDDPVSPKILLNVAVASAVGLALGVGLALLLVRRQRVAATTAAASR